MLPVEPIALIVVLAKASIDVECERLRASLRDNIDDTSCGIASIECGDWTFHDLNVVDITEDKSVEVDIVHILSRKPFAVDEDKHALSAKAREVHVALLVH